MSTQKPIGYVPRLIADWMAAPVSRTINTTIMREPNEFAVPIYAEPVSIDVEKLAQELCNAFGWGWGGLSEAGKSSWRAKAEIIIHAVTHPGTATPDDFRKVMK